MKVLQLCNKPPFPSVDGGTMAMNSITQGLLAAGCEVRVLSVCSEKHPVLKNQMTDQYLQSTRFEAVPVDLGIHVLDAGVAWICGESYHVKRFVSNEFAARLRAILEEEEFDVVHVESIFLTPYVPVIRKHSQACIVLRAHNVEHLIWQRMAKSERNYFKRRYIKHLALTLRAYEVEHLNVYDGVMGITDTDVSTLQQMGCRKPMMAIPFGIQLNEIPQVEEEPDSLFHIGSMDWMPNQEGIRWFLTRVWPLVHEQMPQLTLHLAGRKMPEEFEQMNVPGVKVEGMVPDAMQFVASKQINVVPLLSGSGIRVKIIEAMSAGKVVITTTVGAEGIKYNDGEHLLIADTPAQFVEQIRRCVQQPDFRCQVGFNAKELIAKEYSHERLAQQVIEFYQQLISRKQS